MQIPAIPSPLSIRRESSETVARRYGVKLAFTCLLCLGLLAMLHGQVTETFTGLDRTVTSDIVKSPMEQEKLGFVDDISTRAPKRLVSHPVNATTVTKSLSKRINHNTPHPPPINVPLPIFVLSLPKSGTTSTHKYFECGRQRSVHWGIRNDTKHPTTIGQCWGNNYRQGRPMLQGCASDKWQIYSDVGYIYQNKERASNTRNGHLNCFYPSIHGLDNIATFYPNATIVLVTRNATAWAERIQRWSGIHERWQSACQGFPNSSSASGKQQQHASTEDWIYFYNQHNANVRKFVKQHSSMKYIEIELESKMSGAILEETLGISQQCWGDCPPSQMAVCGQKLPQLPLHVQSLRGSAGASSSIAVSNI
ncbi:hypothetical protein MPSEU_000119800 [Mayamaea pseudoterrestris]|nr:hypothetical protein MPSEU_000119800 [Mayamaea pseudoterrestris]